MSSLRSMVVAPQPEAAEAAADTLEAGGNAVDAAIVQGADGIVLGLPA